MAIFKSISGSAAFLALALSAAPAIAANDVIESAKNRCLIGEQLDGYLGFVDGASISDALRREVRDVNQRRKAAYANIARQNGVTLESIGTITGEKLISQADRGECVENEDGEWVKR